MGCRCGTRPCTAPLLPGAEDYWQKQRAWIESGEDPEYEVSAWVPAHLQLLGGSMLYSFTSFGVLTFHEGFFEVDLMNYYNAQLLMRSQSGPLALALGWHIWSVLRGIGYLFLTFEAVSLALAWVSGVAVASAAARRWRWGVGLSFILADGVAKYVALESVREGLFTNLL